MPISFANPALAWGALAAAIPVIVHLLQRRKPKTHPFAAIELVRRSQQRNVKRLRLKRLLLLIARTLLLLLIPLALARPRFESPAAAAAAPEKGPAATAIVVDASLSMGYRVGGKTLLDRAREDARELLVGLSSEEPITVMACAGPIVPPAAPHFDRALARRAIDDIEPTFRAADLSGCVAAAAQALADSPLAGKRIYVATDLTAAGWRLDLPPATVPTEEGEVLPEVTILDAARGKELPNLALTALSIESASDLGPRGRAFVYTVRNFGSEEAKDVQVELVVDDEVVAKGFVDVPGGGATTKRLAHRFPGGATFAGTLRLGHDALAADDEKPFVVHVPRDLRALIVDGAPSPVRYRDEAFFVEAALRSGGSPVVARVIDMESLPGEELSSFDLLFLLNTRPPDPQVAERIASFVEGGGGAFLAVGDNVDPDGWNGLLSPILPRRLHLVKTAAERGREDQRPARFGEVDLDHPILGVFRNQGLEGFLSSRTWRYFLLQPGTEGDGSRVLATWDDGAPALVTKDIGKGRVLLYTSTADRDWSDWPIQTSFLPTVQQASAWLARSLEESRSRDALVGATWLLPSGEDSEGISVVGPDGRERTVASTQEGWSVSGLDRPGIYRVLGPGGAERSALDFAVQIDPIESDTRRLAEGELKGHLGGERAVVEQSPVADHREKAPLWSVLSTLGVLAFLAEGWLVRR